MEFTILDKSNYLKGLLLLIGKDRRISKEERNYVISAGQALGFAKSFCQNAVTELLRNEYISQEPPKFSDSDIAKKFISEGLNLAFIDSSLDVKELEFLKETAKLNGIEEDWYDESLRNFAVKSTGS